MAEQEQIDQGQEDLGASHENNLEKEENEGEEAEDQNDLMYIYEWVDKIPLSRSKKNIARDFSDAVLMAEILKKYFPKLVELHNYPSVNSTDKKILNWNTLNAKVLKKIGVRLTKKEIAAITKYEPNAVENVLARLYEVIQNTTGLNIGGPEGKKRKTQDNIAYLKKVLEEKDNNIQQLNDIIEVLEMKLNSSQEMEKTLQNKVNELSDILRSKGFDV